MTGISVICEADNLISPVVSNIINALNIMMETMETTQLATKMGFDATAIVGIKEEILCAESALVQYQEQLEKINQHIGLVKPALQDTNDYEWQSSAMPMFTNSSTDRLRLEINAVNSLMDEMLQTQASISRRAMSMAVLPSGAMNDIAGLHNRMRQMQSRIREINDTPINMRTDELNNELEMLRRRFGQVMIAQKQFSASLTSGNIEAANAAFLRIDSVLGTIEGSIRDNIHAQEQFNDVSSKGPDIFADLSKIIKKLGIGEAIKNMAVLMYSSAAELEATDKKYQKAFAGMTNMADTFIADFQNLTPVTTSVAKSMASGFQDLLIPMGLGRTEAAEMTGETMNLIGALANFYSATKTAEDVVSSFRSALTGEYDSLKDLGIQVNESLVMQKAMEMGYATSIETVTNAAKAQALIALAYEQSNKALETYNVKELDTTTKMQLMQSGFKDTFANAGQAMLPGINKLFEKIQLHMPFIESTFASVGSNIGYIADIAASAFDALSTGAEFVADNWSIIEPILLGTAAAIIVYTIAINGATIAHKAAEIAIWAWTAAQAVFSAVMALNPVYLVILAVIALITVIYTVIAIINKVTGSTINATGVIFGALNWVLQLIKNIGIWAANVGLGIWKAFGAAVDNIKIAFSNCFINIRSGFLTFVNIVLTGIQNIIEWLNKIPGVSIDTGSIAAQITSNAAEIATLQESKDKYINIGDAFYEGYNTFNAFVDGWGKEAWEDGYIQGESFNDIFKNFNADGVLEELAQNATYGMMRNDEFLDNMGAISDNTRDISDSMETTEEDLSYLKDIAEQDAINRFTTAEIRVDLGGVTNQVNSNADLDGIVNYLTNALEEQMTIMAEGVH